MNTVKLSKRIFAYLIDILIVSLPVIAGLIWFFYFINMSFNYAIPWYFLLLGGFLIKWLIYVLFSVLILLISNGRTLGNLIFGIKIVHANLKHLSFKDALCISAVHGLISMMIISLFYMIIVHTERSVSDRLTDTYSIDWRNSNL